MAPVSVQLQSEKGFSLIEVLIALTIMMGTVTILAMSWSGSQLRLRKMKLNHQAAFLLDFKMADMQREYGQQFQRIPDEDAGDFTDLGKEYEKFTWKLTSQEFELPDLTPLLIQDAQNSGGGGGADGLLIAMMSQLTDFFGQAVKEVTITIVYTLGKNNVEFSATSFVVDFTQQLPLPTGGGASPGLGGQ